MKVTGYKTIDVEVECDIEMDDIIAEFAQRKDEATEDYWRRFIPALDAITRILADIPDETIAAFSNQVRRTVGERLTMEAARYQDKP